MLEFVKKLGAPRLAAMGVVSLGLVGFFVYIIMRMSQPQMALLFSDLTLEDSSQIVKELERRQVRFQLRNDGAQLFVPQEQVARVRLQLAESACRVAAVWDTRSSTRVMPCRRPLSCRT